MPRNRFTQADLQSLALDIGYRRQRNDGKQHITTQQLDDLLLQAVEDRQTIERWLEFLINIALASPALRIRIEQEITRYIFGELTDEFTPTTLATMAERFEQHKDIDPFVLTNFLRPLH